MFHRAAARLRLPRYACVCLAAMAAAQLFVYYGTRLVLPRLTLHVLTGPLDAAIPLSPPWVTVYCLAFPFWIVSGLWVLSGGKPYAYRFTAAYVLAMGLSGAVFLLWPVTLSRPAITGGGLFDRWLAFIYRADSPTNLCPSLHAVISYACFRGALGSRHIPRWYRAFSFVFFLLVCCSVLLVKQHALVDVPAGVVCWEAAHLLARCLRLERVGSAIDRHFTGR